jgi:hypothetical protein
MYFGPAVLFLNKNSKTSCREIVFVMSTGNRLYKEHRRKIRKMAWTYLY